MWAVAFIIVAILVVAFLCGTPWRQGCSTLWRQGCSTLWQQDRSTLWRQGRFVEPRPPRPGTGAIIEPIPALTVDAIDCQNDDRVIGNRMVIPEFRMRLTTHQHTQDYLHWIMSHIDRGSLIGIEWAHEQYMLILPATSDIGFEGNFVVVVRNVIVLCGTVGRPIAPGTPLVFIR